MEVISTAYSWRTDSITGWPQSKKTFLEFSRFLQSHKLTFR